MPIQPCRRSVHGVGGPAVLHENHGLFTFVPSYAKTPCKYRVFRITILAEREGSAHVRISSWIRHNSAIYSINTGTS